MSQQAMDVVRRFIEEVWNHGDYVCIDELIHPEYEVDGERVGPDWVRRNVESFRQSFPDLTVTILEEIGDSSRAATLCRLRGPHQATWRGISATGNVVDYREAAFWKVEDGFITSGAFVAESLTLRIQLGQISPDIWHSPPASKA